MAGLSTLNRRGGALRALSLGVAALLLAVVARPALAVVPKPTGFEVDLSPSARILDALDANRAGDITTQQYHDIIYDESCDNPLLRIMARNRPAIMVTNFDGVKIGQKASVAPITSFTLQINEGDFAFGTGDGPGSGFTNFIRNSVYTDPGVSITGSSTSPDGKLLTVNFSGLTAGKKAIFYVDLDTTDPSAYMYPDYRVVLFGAPLNSGDSPTAPADASATFTGPLPAPNTQTLGLTFTQQTTVPEWAETNVREYHESDKMEVTSQGVPEPSSIVLTLAGIMALAGGVRKSRRAA